MMTAVISLIMQRLRLRACVVDAWPSVLLGLDPGM